MTLGAYLLEIRCSSKDMTTLAMKIRYRSHTEGVAEGLDEQGGDVDTSWTGIAEPV